MVACPYCESSDDVERKYIATNWAKPDEEGNVPDWQLSTNPADFVTTDEYKCWACEEEFTCG